MKVTNGQVFVAVEPLKKLMAEKLPVKPAWGLAKLSQKLNEPYKAIEDVRNNLIRKYGEVDEKGNTAVKQDSASWAKFVEEFNELMKQETEIVFEKIHIPEKISYVCDSCKHNTDRTLEIDANTLLALEPFIEV